MFDPEFNFASKIVTKITPELLKSIMLTICREISATSESINERNISGIISRHIGYTKTGDFNLIKKFCLKFNFYHYKRVFPGRSYQLTSGCDGPEIVYDNPNWYYWLLLTIIDYYWLLLTTIDAYLKLLMTFLSILYFYYWSLTNDYKLKYFNLNSKTKKNN